MTDFRSAVSRNGHPTDELKSWLQKAIRRGLKVDAVYCAVELDLLGFPGAVWNTLRTVVSEDIGLAEPGLAAEIHTLHMFWKEASKEPLNMSNRLHIVHAVLACCEARKSRLVDNVLIAMYDSHASKMDTPDWALDKHTKRGAQMGRGVEHFFTEGAKLENEDKTYSNSAMEASAKQVALRKETR